MRSAPWATAAPRRSRSRWTRWRTARAVRNGVKRAMVVTTLPFGSYSGPEDAVRTAALMKEGGADGVHFEGTSR